MSFRDKLKSVFKSSTLEKYLIILALTVIITVELVVNCVSMAIMAPGAVERIGFVSMALVIVALGIPSYLMGNKGLWLCFMILAVFLNTSFIVESLRVQSTKNHPELDYEVKRLDKVISDSLGAESGLQAEYNKAVSGENMSRLKDTLDKKVEERHANEDLRLKRIAYITDNPVINGSDVFVAIPRASGLLPEEVVNRMSGPIQMAFFLLLFGASQRALVVFAKHGAKQANEVKPEESARKPRFQKPRPATDDEKEIRRWVGATWVYARHPTRSPRGAMVKKSTFMTQVKNFDNDLYDRLLSRSIELGIIKDGVIIEKNQEKVVKELLTG